jgi:hypothetical protein
MNNIANRADAGAKLSLRKPLTVLSIAAAIGLAATIVVAREFSGSLPQAWLARGVIGGMILGTNAWPLSRSTSNCNEQGQCGWVLVTIDE